MVPKFSESGLSSNVPNSEAESLIVHFFNIESNGRHGGDGLVQFHLIEDGGLSGAVEAEHEDLGFHVSEGVEQFVDELTHVN